MSPDSGSHIPWRVWTPLHIPRVTLAQRHPVPLGPQQLPLGLVSPFICRAACRAAGGDFGGVLCGRDPGAVLTSAGGRAWPMSREGGRQLGACVQCLQGRGIRTTRHRLTLCTGGSV